MAGLAMGARASQVASSYILPEYDYLYYGPGSMRAWAPRPGQPSLHTDAQRIDYYVEQDHRGDHHNVPWNNPDTDFDFTDANYGKVREILGRYPSGRERSAIIPLLDLAQRQNDGWLPLAAMHKVAAITQSERMAVYEVATFYTIFNRTPVGKFHVQVCTTTPCMLCGAQEIVRALERRLGIHIGGTTPDGMVTLGEVECAGACVNAPLVAIGDDYYEDLTPASAVSLIDKLYAGKTIVPGPQVEGRRSSEPVGAPSSLTDPPLGPYCRDLSALQPAKAA